MVEPFKIIHVLGGLETGGAESFVMNMYRAIDRSIVQFDFIKHTPKIGSFEKEIALLGGQIFACPRYVGKNHSAYVKWWRSFFYEHPEYHVVHGHVRSTAAIYLKIAKSYGLVTISHSHSTSNGNGLSALAKNIMQLPIRNIADYFFACSDIAGKWLFGKDVVNHTNYCMIPNGIDIGHFMFDAQKRKLTRQRLGIKEDTFVMGHIGRFATVKNHTYLIQLFAQYQKTKPNSCLLMVGDGELFDDVKSQCQELGIADKVIMPGSQTNISAFYHAMDAFVFPSLWEGFGIAVIEAQANGLPCLVSDHVPLDVIINRNIKILSLSHMSAWRQELEKLQDGKRVSPDNVHLKVYDAKSIAADLQNFYLAQYVKEKSF